MAERLIPHQQPDRDNLVPRPRAGSGILTAAAIDRLTTPAPNACIRITAVERTLTSFRN